jgi:predicted dehydrogenase
MRIAIAGTGYWAEVAHARALASHADFDLVGTWGRSPDKAAALAGRVGAQAFERFEDMLDATDVVSFAVPPFIQPGLAVAAARAGKHLLLEKPIALTLAEADRMVMAAGEAGVSSIVFFTRRFDPETEAGIERTAAGTWTSAHARFLTAALLPGTPYSDSRWRHEHGALWDIGPHVLSVLLPILGPVAEVAARAEPDRSLCLRLTHDRGAISDATLSLHDTASSALTEDYRFSGPSGEGKVGSPTITRHGALAAAASELAEAIRQRRTDGRCDVAFGREIVKVLSAGQASMRSGGVTRLPV